MCVICVSEKGVKQPTRDLLWMMWRRNPHGAGYMFAKSKYVYIRKGFMTFDDFFMSVRDEGFTKDDPVVYHFRIATQAGVNPEMTHPFILTDDIEKTKVLRARVNVGVCHNGIISMTSNHDAEYSDTALFIANYMSKMIDKPGDLLDTAIQDEIYSMIHSKMAVLDYAGNVTMIGKFLKDVDGLMYSNNYFMPYIYNENSLLA